MYEGQATIDTPIDDTYLRRYMSMAKFTALVSTQSLFFPTLWQLEDRREGTLPDHWSTEETGDLVTAIRNRIKVSVGMKRSRNQMLYGGCMHSRRRR